MKLRWNIAALTLIAALLASGAGVAQGQERGLDIYFVDVMGGAATLVVTPEGESVLIDSGWPGFEGRDPDRIVHVLKDVAGCERLDHLITTHWHTDHYGGVEGLAERVEIGQYWDRGLPQDEIEGLDFPDGPKPDNPLLIAYLKASEGNRKVLSPGDPFPLQGDLRAVVLASGGHVYKEDEPLLAERNPHCEAVPAAKPEDRSDNARSLALIFRLGDFDFLDCGDLTWNVEAKLVCPLDRISMSQEQDIPSPIDLYQVTHHGLDISNHPTLLRTIDPTVAIMNNGPRKGGSPETVQRLKALPSLQAFYALHKNQATGPEENADPEYIANQDPEGGQYIHVHVEPDGSKYTVKIGADGPSRTFETR